MFRIVLHSSTDIQKGSINESRLLKYRKHRWKLGVNKCRVEIGQSHGSFRAVICAGKTVLFNPFPNKPWFLRVCRTSLLKTLWEKEKLLVTSNFSFSHSVFYLYEELSAFFIKPEIAVCKPFQFGRV